jgi:hypothetical protein
MLKLDDVAVMLDSGDSFDYTEWRQKNLWLDKTFRQIHSEAAEHERDYDVPPGVTVL